MNPILTIILLTLVPALELRVSIPYGILVSQMNWLTVFLICVITNAILGPVIFIILDKFIHVFFSLQRARTSTLPYLYMYRGLGSYMDKRASNLPQSPL